MMHKRNQIRYAIARALIAGAITEVQNAVTPVTYRIFTNRPTPAWENELPAIFVYTGTGPAGSEAVTQIERGPTIYKRALKTVIEILVEADDAVDDVLDSIAEKVEQIIGDNQEKFPRGLMLDPDGDVIENVGMIDLSSTDMGLAEDGRKIVGSLKLYLDIPYRAGLGEPQDSGDTLDLIHTHINNTNGSSAETEQILNPDYVPLVADFSWVSSLAGQANKSSPDIWGAASGGTFVLSNTSVAAVSYAWTTSWGAHSTLAVPTFSDQPAGLSGWIQLVATDAHGHTSTKRIDMVVWVLED
jgi:hypothetical protein